ncbi:unnamed protein product, partial [Allacma fusca]
MGHSETVSGLCAIAKIM